MRTQRARYVLAFVIVGAMLLPVSGATSADSDDSWTVMIYCGADGQYYTDEAIKFNVLQCQEALMEASSTDGVKVFVFMDLDGSANSRYFELTEDMELPSIDKSWNGVGGTLGVKGEWDASSVATLNTFMNTVATDGGNFYSGSQKLLVLKNGHAWCGVCPDATESTGEAVMMPLTDIAGALSDRGVDILAFDGDNMASIEAAYELRGAVQYMVATQQDIPIDGLPYKTMVGKLADRSWGAEEFAIEMTEDYVTYYDNRYGNKLVDAHLLSSSQMAVTASALYLGDPSYIQAVVDEFDAVLEYMIENTFDEDGNLLENAWIPTYRDCLASARDYALIGKMGDQAGYEWLPDIYTWLYGVALLVEPYDDDDPIIDMVTNDFLPLLEEDAGLVVSNVESNIILVSGNSDAHGMNFWFPPTWLQWEDFVADEARARTYLYDGAAIPLPAEYYCIDCPTGYEDIGLDFVDESLWMDFLEIYYDSRWLFVLEPGNADPNKPDK